MKYNSNKRFKLLVSLLQVAYAKSDREILQLTHFGVGGRGSLGIRKGKTINNKTNLWQKEQVTGL